MNTAIYTHLNIHTVVYTCLCKIIYTHLRRNIIYSLIYTYNNIYSFIYILTYIYNNIDIYTFSNIYIYIYIYIYVVLYSG